MYPWLTPRRANSRATVAATVLVASLAGVGLAAADPAPRQTAAAVPAAISAPAPVPGAAAGRAFSVTLVTGDTVRVTPLPGDRYATAVQPGPGRQDMAFTTTRTTAGGLRVVPADALPLLAADRVDGRLFDVLLLHKLGHGRGEVPVLLGRAGTGTQQGPARPARPGQGMIRPGVPADRAGARTVRTLPQIGVRSVRVERSAGPRFWAATRAAGIKAVDKVWLNGRRTLSLNRSVAQVGARAAWKAGFTGKGVTVAVLDSGYDAKHPDLKGVVTVSKDFTGSREGVKDVVGHGTHVAGTVAGRGTASKGTYTGVAKGARLAIGKVCATDTCTDEAILNGMVWAAAEVKAKIVNLSLGGSVDSDNDPLEQAVEVLTARTGTLFVAAAGNSGPTPGTVGSPASAPSALAVGAVGRTDKVSDFSSRGPVTATDHTGPYTVKPDVTAPGENIVAARAAGTLDGEATGPGKRYATLSGTSMATPHVAGAAALLAQQHPRWKAAQLKAALTATAKPARGATAHQQGAGRVDLTRAIAATVLPSTGVLDLGYTPWPHTGAGPVTRTVSYSNPGRTPVTLTLSAAINRPDGSPAPDGVFALGHRSLTIAAGGTARTTVTFRPAGQAVGAWSGRLTATTADGRTTLGTALGGYVEPEAYDVTLSGISRTGARPVTSALLIDRRTGDSRQFSTYGGTALQRVPVGRYVLFGVVDEDPSDGAPITTVEVRTLDITAATALRVDARRAVKVRTTVDRADAVPGQYLDVSATVQPANARQTVSGSVYARPGRLLAVPGGAVADTTLALQTEFVKRGTDGVKQPPTPYVYHVAAPLHAGLGGDPILRLKSSDFAEIRNTYARQSAKEQMITSAHGVVPGAGAAIGWGRLLGHLDQRTDYVTAQGVPWHSTMISTGGGDATFLDGSERAYRSGERVTDRWNAAVFSPAFRTAADRRLTREGDIISGSVSLLSDAAGHAYSTNGTDTVVSQLTRNGRRVWRGDSEEVRARVPAATATYRLETSVTHTVPWSTLSKRTTTAWTFRSGRAGGSTPVVLPLSLVRFAPPLDRLNRARKATTVTVPIRVENAPHSTASPVRTLTVQVSHDGGRTWKATPVTGSGTSWSMRVTHPRTAGPVSLRSTMTRSDGGAVTQTVHNAYLTH